MKTRRRRRRRTRKSTSFVQYKEGQGGEEEEGEEEAVGRAATRAVLMLSSLPARAKAMSFIDAQGAHVCGIRRLAARWRGQRHMPSAVG